MPVRLAAEKHDTVQFHSRYSGHCFHILVFFIVDIPDIALRQKANRRLKTKQHKATSKLIAEKSLALLKEIFSIAFPDNFTENRRRFSLKSPVLSRFYPVESCIFAIGLRSTLGHSYLVLPRQARKVRNIDFGNDNLYVHICHIPG